MSEGIYQPPDHHDDHIKKMVVFLVAFFGILLALAVSFVVFANKIVVYLPFAAEKQFVRPYEKLAEHFYRGESSLAREEIEAYLADMAEQLAPHMDMPDDYEINVHYVDSAVVNAFATLGGHIFIFRGLIEALPDENSLAMVVAHEMAHIKHRDPLAGMGRGLAIQMLFGFISGDYSRGTDIALQGGDMGLLYFSREQEEAADILAITALQGRYGHIQGYDQLFLYVLNQQEVETDADGQSTAQAEEISEWFSTHPLLQSRIDTLTDYAQQQGWSLGSSTHGSSTHGPSTKPLPRDLLENIEKVRKEEREKKKAEK